MTDQAVGGSTSGSSDWAGGLDIAYRAQNLRHFPIEQALDESVRLVDLWRHILVSLMVGFWTWLASQIVCTLILIGPFFSAVNSADGTEETEATAAAATLMALIVGIPTLVGVLTFAFYFLYARLDEPVGEWRTLIENRRAAAETAYAKIIETFHRREVPVPRPVVARIRSDVEGHAIVSNKLVVQSGPYFGYVTVAPYGTGLYVGWMMYRRRSGATILATWCKDVVGALYGASDQVIQMLRTERVRALREAIHASVREGVEVAIAGVAELRLTDVVEGGVAIEPEPERRSGRRRTAMARAGEAPITGVQAVVRTPSWPQSPPAPLMRRPWP